jgi:peptide/nickel transport system substrate-binding protein
MSMGRGFSFNEGLQVRDQWRDGTMELAVEGWYAMYVQWIEPTPAVLGDVRFRRALLHALDRQQMVDVLQAGLVPVAHGYLGSWEPEYKEVESSITRYEYDPSRATQMTEELGYSKGADGFFRDRAGQPLALQVRSANEPEIDVNSNLTVRDAWRALGVAAESELYSRQLSRDLQYRATFPAFQLQRQPNRLDALIRYQTSQVALAENNWRGENKGRYTNPEMDALIDRFYTTIPPQERNQVLAQILGHMTERLHVLGLFNDGIPVFVGSRLRNVYPVNQTWNATEWDKGA